MFKKDMGIGCAGEKYGGEEKALSRAPSATEPGENEVGALFDPGARKLDDLVAEI